MLRNTASKVAWVGRTASMVFGLALVLALVMGVASMAFGANGSNFILGNLKNSATALTKLTGNVNGAAMQVVNNNTGTDDTALSLAVQAGEAPMTVNSSARVANLNADKIDGIDTQSGKFPVSAMPGITGYEVVQDGSDLSGSESMKSAEAQCPPGKRVLGGGAWADSADIGAAVGKVITIYRDQSYDDPSGNGHETVWIAEAAEIGTSTSAEWSLSVRAICANVAPDAGIN
ncbi:MAG: hypothetical protein M3P49_08060 [Actinomycetota bacterium]|nr:hypothetical protein [Actinomycetota bacterium]